MVHLSIYLIVDLPPFLSFPLHLNLFYFLSFPFLSLPLFALYLIDIANFQTEIDEYIARTQQQTQQRTSYSANKRPRFQKLESQPGRDSWMVGGDLRDYQLEGLNWLIYTWCKNTNAILADEM